MNRISSVPLPVPDTSSSSEFGETLLEGIRRAAAEAVPDGAKQVIEVGCGDGKVMEKLGLKRGRLIVGIDRSAMKKTPSAHYVRADMIGLPFPDGSFDAVLCINVTVMLTAAGMKQGVGEMLRIVRSRGVLLLHISNQMNPVLGTRTWIRRTVHSMPLSTSSRSVDRLCRSYGARVDEVLSLAPSPGRGGLSSMHRRWIGKHPRYSPILILKITKPLTKGRFPRV